MNYRDILDPAKNAGSKIILILRILISDMIYINHKSRYICLKGAPKTCRDNKQRWAVLSYYQTIDIITIFSSILGKSKVLSHWPDFGKRLPEKKG
jgi:hypothetical protein